MNKEQIDLIIVYIERLRLIFLLMTDEMLI